MTFLSSNDFSEFQQLTQKATSTELLHLGDFTKHSATLKRLMESVQMTGETISHVLTVYPYALISLCSAALFGLFKLCQENKNCDLNKKKKKHHQIINDFDSLAWNYG